MTSWSRGIFFPSDSHSWKNSHLLKKKKRFEDSSPTPDEPWKKNHDFRRLVKSPFDSSTKTAGGGGKFFVGYGHRSGEGGTGRVVFYARHAAPPIVRRLKLALARGQFVGWKKSINLKRYERFLYILFLPLHKQSLIRRPVD